MAKGKRQSGKAPPKFASGEFRMKRGKLFCEKVEDGDTLKGTVSFRRWGVLRTIAAHVQLAGIKVPELHIMEGGRLPDDLAIEAMNYTKRRIEGKTVKIKLAVDKSGQWIRESQFSQSNRWADPRVLAIVFPRWHFESINVKLIRKGYARLHNRPDWMSKDFEKALERAQRKARKRHFTV